MMYKKGEISMALPIVIFMAIVLMLAFIPTIFNTQKIMTDKMPVSNELINLSSARNSTHGINQSNNNFTVTNYPTSWKISECPLESIVYGNATENYVLDTDYKVYASSGIIQVIHTNKVVQGSNATYVDYSYCADGYNKDSSSRTTAGMIGLFTVLALLGTVIGYLKFKDLI